MKMVRVIIASLVCALFVVPAHAENTRKYPHASLAPGTMAPDFTLPDQDGKLVTLSNFKGHYVVLQWTNAQCPFVQRHYDLNTTNNLVSKWAGKNVFFLAIDSSNFVIPADLKKTAEEKKTNYPLLDDSSGTVGETYGAKSTPHVFIVGPDGTIVYQGGMDNDQYGDMGDKRINYVDQALTELLAGKPVSVPTSRSYGCSIKYRDF